MSVLLSIFLGIVQGIAEFLPISSSGHLSIFQNLFKLPSGEGSRLLFDVLLHLGTMVSICLSYRKDLRQMISETADFLRHRTDDRMDGARIAPSVRQVLLILIATLPLVLAIPFYSKVEALFYNTGFVGFALIITGALLFVSDKLLEYGVKDERSLTVKDALLIGVAQLVALIPGLSRSGTTIVVGLSRGARRDFALRFSLLLSLPAVLGSAVVTFFSALKTGVEWTFLPAYLIGFIFAAIIGYFSIQFIRKLLLNGKFGRFAYYCWGVGALTLLLSVIL
ncbi:MAG: undecaprenyl-diphosphate phosphatase [Oscillospiraceae bacterium]|jgi:undecaprenyl-diphosphatase|nr:undecaprenyl-diphosphate phosphatase [Oscillospiraceae bacterium]